MSAFHPKQTLGTVGLPQKLDLRLTRVQPRGSE